MTSASFVIRGAPRTKKTSNQIVTFHGKDKDGNDKDFNKILPSEAFRDWFKVAMQQSPLIRRAVMDSGFVLPITATVQIRAHFYRKQNSGDLTGFMQALADYLQEPRYNKQRKRTRDGAGVICDDVQITSWDGSRLFKDDINPRIEVVLTVTGVENLHLFPEAS